MKKVSFSSLFCAFSYISTAVSSIPHCNILHTKPFRYVFILLEAEHEQVEMKGFGFPGEMVYLILFLTWFFFSAHQCLVGNAENLPGRKKKLPGYQDERFTTLCIGSVCVQILMDGGHHKKTIDGDKEKPKAPPMNNTKSETEPTTKRQIMSWQAEVGM